eukprot:TRINITY_DN8393_c0_g1_i3.p1 TRINITY_DN8393_c0_g1~~TRINITY_DN8393_c0_g1_i3.p1  ORF type:complete len:447 (+),score=67.24 TRINITY_DN8393_c0_g1_i3:48-1388(+)
MTKPWLLLLCLACCCQSSSHEGSHPCVNGAIIIDEGKRRCLCNQGTQCGGAFCIQYEHQGKRQAWQHSICKHCSCISKDDISQMHHIGAQNLHEKVNPVTSKQLSFLFDDRSQLASQLRQPQMQVSRGSFNVLQQVFPDCAIPGKRLAKEPIETQRALAREFVKGCQSKWQAVTRHLAKPETLAIAAVFTSKPDPQRGSAISASDVSYLASYYESLRTANMAALILHDGLDAELVQTLTTQHIRFRHVSWSESSGIDPKTSPNDARFIVIDRVLRNTTFTAAYKHLVVTDLHDVRFRYDVGLLLKARPDVELWLGEDRLAYRDNLWTMEQVEMCGPSFVPVFQSFGTKMTLNVGAIAGRVAPVRGLITMLTNLLTSRTWTRHPWRDVYMPCDMAAITAAVMCGYDRFDARDLGQPCKPKWTYYSGAPFVSPFTSYLDQDPYAIVHK